MFKTRQEAQAKLDELTPENYYSHKVDPHAALAGIWSKSELKKLMCNTADWFARVPFFGSAKTEFGNLVDLMATEPEKFHTTYLICTEGDKRKKEYKDAKLQAEDRNMEVVTTKDIGRAESALNRLQDNPYGRVLLAGRKQVIFKGIVKLTGPLGEVYVPLKSRTDSVTDHEDGSITIEDLKTTQDCNPESIRGVCKHLSYHWQDAIYTMLGKMNGHVVRDFRFVFVGTDEPFHVQPVKFDQATRATALKCLEQALSTVYWVGHGYGLKKLYPEELIIGPYTPKDFWNTCPDFNLPLVNVEWLPNN